MTIEAKSEEWKGIEGHPYKVSNHGRILSDATGKIIRLSNNNGYLGFVSYNKGKEKFLYVHRVEMMAFDPCDGMEGLCVNHIDFNRANNLKANLEWVTYLQNQQHSIKNDRYIKANRIHSEKMKTNTAFIKLRKPVILTKETAVIECRSATEAAKIVGVELSTLCRAARLEKETNGFKVYYA